MKISYYTFQPNINHFLGSWENKFDKIKTRKEPFYQTTDEKHSVDMMKMKKPIKVIFKNLDSFGAKVLQLPYAGKRMSMILILPEKRLQIKTVEKRLKSRGLQKLLQEFDEAITENRTESVRVILPKFKLKKTLRIDVLLKQIGMTAMFSRDANFEKMFQDGANKEQMKVSEVNLIFSWFEEFHRA